MADFTTAYNLTINNVGLKDRIEKALLERSQEASLYNTAKCDERKYTCSVEGCNRNGYAKGFCNAHYIRFCNGSDMNLPVKSRKSNSICTTCGKELKGKGGWNLCTNHYKKERFRIIKEIIIDHLGGICAKCKNAFPTPVFDFHHLGDKIDGVSFIISNASIDEIVKEVCKCIILCANCHRMEHYKTENYG